MHIRVNELNIHNLKIFIHRFDELNLEAEPNNEALSVQETPPSIPSPLPVDV